MKLTKKELKTETDIEIFYPTLVDIWQEVFTPIIGQGQVAYMLRVYQSMENILQEIKEGTRYFGLFLREECVGYTAYEQKETYLYISKLYIKSSLRGKGYMRAVFEAYDCLSLSLALKQRLRVNQHNTQAISVDEHLGFKKIGTDLADIGNGYVMDDFIYEKNIPDTLDFHNFCNGQEESIL